MNNCISLKKIYNFRLNLSIKLINISQYYFNIIFQYHLLSNSPFTSYHIFILSFNFYSIFFNIINNINNCYLYHIIVYINIIAYHIYSQKIIKCHFSQNNQQNNPIFNIITPHFYIFLSLY
jgi:hypothetical protein